MEPSTSAHDFTLRQLQIFWTVAQTRSLTRAAKQLDIRQPSISQQLSRMEHAVGGKLIRFVNSEMRLTPAGEFLLEEAGRILGAVDRASAGLAEFFAGSRGRLAVGALPSVARNLLVPAFERLRERHPGYTLDIVEVTPREAAEQLHGRILDVAIVSTYAATARTGLRAIPVLADEQRLAVPNTMPDLSNVSDPESELSGEDLGLLRRTVRYVFGSEHSDRVNSWYDELIPGAEFAARCRSYETALAFVEGGVASAIVPELAVRQGARRLFDVTLYALPVPPRQTVLLVPEQYVSLPGTKALAEALGAAASATVPIDVRPVPGFAKRGLVEERDGKTGEATAAAE